MAGAELVTLFGSDLAEVGEGRMGFGWRVVGGQKVSYRDLSGMLLALAVVNLVSQDAAELRHEQVKKLLRARDVLQLRASGDGEGFDSVVAACARNGLEVAHLTITVLGRTGSPELALIGRAQSFLEPCGAVTKSQGAAKRLIGVAAQASQYEIDEAAAEALRPQWDAMRQRWEGWKGDNPTLAALLLKQCKDSVGEAKAAAAGSASNF